MGTSGVLEPTYERERYLWLRQKTRLDLLALDEELSEIATLVQEAGEKTASANDMLSAAKDNLDGVEAQVAASLRVPPIAGKARSETQITSEIPLDKRVTEAQATLAAAKFDASLWTNLTDALRLKSSSMRAAADLVQAGYLTTDYILSKRRGEMRTRPPVAEAAKAP